MPTPPLLDVTDLHVRIGDTPIVRGVSLTIQAGEVHAIMGRNGSGKSTLVSALMGHPRTEITQGSVRWQGQDLLALAPHERALAGLFLAFQYPRELPGVSLRSFLYAAVQAQRRARQPDAKPTSVLQFQDELREAMTTLHLDPSFAERAVNAGFSGGEKKKVEILQLHLLRPRLALLDETDSGLDVDALRVVGAGVQQMRSPQFSALLVTHYARILAEVKPDHVHVMLDGQLVESGGADLAERLEREGYQRYGTPKKRLSLS